MTPTDATNCPCCQKADECTRGRDNIVYYRAALEEHHANMDALNERVRELESALSSMGKAARQNATLFSDVSASLYEGMANAIDALLSKSSPAGTGGAVQGTPENSSPPGTRLPRGTRLSESGRGHSRWTMNRIERTPGGSYLAREMKRVAVEIGQHTLSINDAFRSSPFPQVLVEHTASSGDTEDLTFEEWALLNEDQGGPTYEMVASALLGLAVVVDTPKAGVEDPCRECGRSERDSTEDHNIHNPITGWGPGRHWFISRVSQRDRRMKGKYCARHNNQSPKGMVCAQCYPELDGAYG